MKEPLSYRENLEDMLQFFGNKRMLNYNDVRNYTGILDNRTLKKRYPFIDGYISVPTLAWVISGGNV